MDKRTIWKFSAVQLVIMPKGAIIRYFGLQHGEPTLWVEVDPDAEQEGRQFRQIGTGHLFEVGSLYIGTWFEGPFVWHLYEVFPNKEGEG